MKALKFNAKLLLAINLKNTGEKKGSLGLFGELNEEMESVLSSSELNYMKVKWFNGIGLFE